MDACISINPRARVAIETMVKGLDESSNIVIGGEITLPEGAEVDYEKIARDSDRDFYMSADQAQEYGLIDVVMSSHNTESK